MTVDNGASSAEDRAVVNGAASVSAVPASVPSAVKPLDYTRMTQPERAKLRAEYVEAQGGLCYHCGQSLSGRPRDDVLSRKLDLRRFPESFLKWPIHLHHNHRSRMTIGAVHAHCNGVLWQYHGE